RGAIHHKIRKREPAYAALSGSPTQPGVELRSSRLILHLTQVSIRFCIVSRPGGAPSTSPVNELNLITDLNVNDLSQGNHYGFLEDYGDFLPVNLFRNVFSASRS